MHVSTKMPAYNYNFKNHTLSRLMNIYCNIYSNRFATRSNFHNIVIYHPMLINFACVADRIQKQVFLCRPLIGATRGSEKASASLQMNEVPVEREGWSHITTIKNSRCGSHRFHSGHTCSSLSHDEFTHLLIEALLNYI